jgi:enoyl-CoA hydratase/carnithine racemase
MVNAVFEPDALMTGVLETATRIAGNAPLSTRQAKKSVSMSTQLDFHTGYQYEIEAYNRLVTTQDRLEGVRAFNEKRKPEFKGQ